MQILRELIDQLQEKARVDTEAREVRALLLEEYLRRYREQHSTVA